MPDEAIDTKLLKKAFALTLLFASLTTIPLAALVVLPSAVRTPVPVVVVAGVAPAPPPIIKAFVAKTAEDAQVVPLEK